MRRSHIAATIAAASIAVLIRVPDARAQLTGTQCNEYGYPQTTNKSGETTYVSSFIHVCGTATLLAYQTQLAKTLGFPNTGVEFRKKDVCLTAPLGYTLDPSHTGMGIKTFIPGTGCDHGGEYKEAYQNYANPLDKEGNVAISGYDWAEDNHRVCVTATNQSNVDRCVWLNAWLIPVASRRPGANSSAPPAGKGHCRLADGSEPRVTPSGCTAKGGEWVLPP